MGKINEWNNNFNWCDLFWSYSWKDEKSINKDIKPILHACENQGNIIKVDASLSAVDVYFELKNAFKEKKWHKL